MTAEGHGGEAAGTLTGITIHPIKGCRRVELDSAVVTATGLEGDRAWQVVTAPNDTDALGEAVTQRRNAALATVAPVPIDGGLTISAPGMGTIDVKRPDAIPSCRSAIVSSSSSNAGGVAGVDSPSSLVPGPHAVAAAAPRPTPKKLRRVKLQVSSRADFRSFITVTPER